MEARLRLAHMGLNGHRVVLVIGLESGCAAFISHIAGQAVSARTRQALALRHFCLQPQALRQLSFGHNASDTIGRLRVVIFSYARAYAYLV